MRLIPSEALPHFENAIYFPMLITILEMDRHLIERGPYKLKAPYLRMIDGALAAIRAELKETNQFLRLNKMRLEKGENDGMFTEYILYHSSYEDPRRYLNVRLKNRSIELLDVYLFLALK
ncbi:hypothetical protein AB1K83_16825 [Sporosarcina sp. 179-K 3D1 HS]|uniref:hypothetical protein n=1 Tax=Sporosarcina sp. 179-K 3D1 HS TaxID=3232169 RepID=UPI0039A0A945